MTDLRELRPDELSCLASIDRSETIDGQYRVVDGALQLVSTHLEAGAWPPAERDAYAGRLRELQAAGGSVFGAWDGGTLLGFVSLDVGGVGGDPGLLKLDMLYVSAGQRGRGLGRALTEQAMARARELGARALYISATPTRATVAFYLGLGARLADRPDTALLALEPDDIHLLLPLD